jgi:hypothetical protein
MIEREFVVVGSPATVRERLEAMARRLNVGHLMTILQFGSMPHEQARKNIELFGREVLPHLQRVWQDEGWDNRWWPERLRHTPERPLRQAARVGA